MASIHMPDPFGQEILLGSSDGRNSKKSWPDLQKAVKNTRKINISLSNKILTGFTFRHVYPKTGQMTRIYFLGVPNTGFTRESFNTLLYVDIPNKSADGQFTPEWHQLLESFYTSSQSFSKEEQLLRERKRLGSFGITSYDIDIKSGKFLFPACSSLFNCSDTVYEDTLLEHSVFPLEVKSSCSATRLDAKICPSNNNIISFICGNDLWVTSCISGDEQRLTFVHKAGQGLANNPRSAGVPSFVIQEEFDRYTGYWWQPVQNIENNSDHVYRILYEETDETEVPILNIVSPSSRGTDIEEHRYPRPGQSNAKSCLRLTEFQLDENGKICNAVDRQMTEPLCKVFPDMEYLVRAGWTPDGRYIWAQLLNRLQTKLQLVLIPLDNFNIVTPTESMGAPECLEIDSDQDEEMTSLNCNINSSNVQILYEDSSDVWVNVHDSLHFLPQEKQSELSFIWSSEKSGYRHLYLVTVPIEEAFQSSSVINRNSDQEIEALAFKEVQITSGDWMVLPKEIFVDEVRKLVYFIGVKDTPLETHLYVVSYENPGEIIRLTKLGSSHTVYMDKECGLFVTVNSNISTPTSSQIYRLKLENGIVQTSLICNLMESPAVVEDYHPPELFSYQSQVSGYMMHGMVFKPHHIEENKTYPVILFVYGGPQVQIVSNVFKGLRYLRLHTMASLGYAVVAIDSRGSACRGLEFECAIKDRLGHVEIADQIEGLEWLSSEVDYIDMSRVAIHGWSYGGYLSLMGLVQRPDIFKVAIAGAPVTTWNLYDTGYTERYLKLPAHGDDSYTRSSVVEMAQHFPSEQNRLLIIQGLMDENVHFYHTTTLIDALIKAGKPYQLQVYPNERHGIRNADCSEHYETMALSFLQQNL